jgi:DNA-binding CsgD family transcriptional regulator
VSRFRTALADLELPAERPGWLTARQWEALTLHVGQGVSCRAAARRMGITRPSVRHLLRVATRNLLARRSTPAELSGLSQRTHNALKRAGLCSRAAIAGAPDEELLRLAGIGPRRLAEVRAVTPALPSGGEGGKGRAP